MNFCLYYVSDGEDLRKVIKRVEQAGWQHRIATQPDRPDLYLLEATKKDYSITEQQYVKDTQFFKQLAQDCNCSYDGWFASA